MAKTKEQGSSTTIPSLPTVSELKNEIGTLAKNTTSQEKFEHDFSTQSIEASIKYVHRFCNNLKGSFTLA